MVARAVAKYLRISSRKVNPYGRAVADMNYKEARAALTLQPARGARILAGVLQSAVANLMGRART